MTTDKNTPGAEVDAPNQFSLTATQKLVMDWADSHGLILVPSEADDLIREIEGHLKTTGDDWQDIKSYPLGTTCLLSFFCETTIQWACVGKYRMGYCEPDGWYGSDGKRLREPTHWMPIPPAPRGKE